MILEYYNKDRYYIRSVNLLVSLLLIELTRFMENKSIENNEEDEQEIISILRYIEIHYKTLTLASLSQHFGYNPNYLSNKLKRKTGQSYKEIISYLRYRVVLELMEETDDSVEEITEKKSAFIQSEQPTNYWQNIQTIALNVFVRISKRNNQLIVKTSS